MASKVLDHAIIEEITQVYSELVIPINIPEVQAYFNTFEFEKLNP